MNATIYGRGQMVIPVAARKRARINRGDVVSVEAEVGRILLIRMEKPTPAVPSKSRLVYRKGRHAVIVGGRKPSPEELRAALADVP